MNFAIILEKNGRYAWIQAEDPIVYPRSIDGLREKPSGPTLYGNIIWGIIGKFMYI